MWTDAFELGRAAAVSDVPVQRGLVLVPFAALHALVSTDKKNELCNEKQTKLGVSQCHALSDYGIRGAGESVDQTPREIPNNRYQTIKDELQGNKYEQYKTKVEIKK